MMAKLYFTTKPLALAVGHGGALVTLLLVPYVERWKNMRQGGIEPPAQLIIE